MNTSIGYNLLFLPLKVTTKIFQIEQLTPADFFAQWLKCRAESENQGSPLGKKIAQMMGDKQHCLFENDFFKAAVFLDTRYNIMLDEEEAEAAKSHIWNIWSQLKALVSEENRSNNDARPSTSFDEQHDGDLVDEWLQSREREKSQNRQQEMTRNEFNVMLEKFDCEPRLARNCDVLAYWEGKKNIYPELFEVSQVVLGVPVTQVSVERSFSHLKFILSDQRASMGEELLEDVLIVRLNRLFNKNAPQNL